MRFSRFYFIVIIILVLLAGGVSVLAYSAVVIKKTFTSRIDTIPSTPPVAIGSQATPSPGQDPSSIPATLSASSPTGAQLRAMLKAQGMDEQAVAKMTDDQLVNLYQDFLKSQQQNQPSTP